MLCPFRILNLKIFQTHAGGFRLYSRDFYSTSRLDAIHSDLTSIPLS